MITTRELENRIREALHASAEETVGKKLDAAVYKMYLENPKNENFGDISANFILRIAKEEKKKPQDLAQAVLKNFQSKTADLASYVGDIRVEGPGFINIALSPEGLGQVLREILSDEKFGSEDKKPGRALLEYVSANPTGPLTVAHGRQAALGDSLIRILRFSGWTVDAEYYNNDEGVQINTLGESLYLRYQEFRGKKIEMPENCYRGAYLAGVAKELAAEVDSGKAQLPSGEAQAKAFCSKFARDRIMKTIVTDLNDFGVKFDHYYSQEELGRSGKVERTLDELKKAGHVFENEGAVWFRSTALGDDKDRVLIKSDKNYTYLTPDIAYHHDKFQRGYTDLINIWGPDHHGYIPRLKASQQALGHDAAHIRILIAQLVTLYKGEEQVRMSTRAGEFVTLREILDEVGKDAGRFFFCMRKLDSHLDFDLELAKKQTPDNPVFYIQYAHARVASIRKLQNERGVTWKPDSADLKLLKAPEEIRLLRLLRQFPKSVSSAAVQLEPCVLVEYLGNLAAAFHQFYTQCRVVTDDAPQTQARLTLLFALQKVIKRGLDLLGVSAPEAM